MLRKIITPLFAAIFALASFTAHAGIEKGDKTFGVNAQLMSEDSGDTLMVIASIGMFTTDTLEIQGVALMADSGDVTLVGLGANANLYIPGKNPDFVPYVGAGAQIISIDVGGQFGYSDTELGLNAQAGFKQFIDENIAINYQLQIVTSSDYDATIASVGLTVFLD